MLNKYYGLCLKNQNKENYWDEYVERMFPKIRLLWVHDSIKGYTTFISYRFRHKIFIKSPTSVLKSWTIWDIKVAGADTIFTSQPFHSLECWILESCFQNLVKRSVVKKIIWKEEMEPLVTTRVVLTWIWMCADNNVTNKWTNFGHYAFGRFCLIFQILGFAGATACSIKFLPIDISTVLFESMFVSGHFNATYSIIHTMQSRHKIANLFTRLSKIYRNCEYFTPLIWSMA